jgi:hypothetical protein
MDVLCGASPDAVQFLCIHQTLRTPWTAEFPMFVLEFMGVWYGDESAAPEVIQPELHGCLNTIIKCESDEAHCAWACRKRV